MMKACILLTAVCLLMFTFDARAQGAKIRSEQHHGSIYDVIPARTGFLKPAGEWNEEEIMARGSRIRVTLNGVIILDADLNDVREEATLKKHPGLKNKSGHVGFLGHGS